MLRTVQNLDASSGVLRPALRAVSSASSEEELAIAYVTHDDERAFRLLHERTAPYLMRVAKRRVRSDDLASDLVQQAFLNAHLARLRFETGQRFRPWITRILVNLILDHQRSEGRRKVSDLEPEELAAPESPHTAERRELKARTHRALAQLGARKRKVIELHWLEEEPFPEVAKLLGEHVSTIKVRAHRAYRELREHLELSA
jgi:RNA polymerase sigma-70 factor (ECF subfamily)